MLHVAIIWILLNRLVLMVQLNYNFTHAWNPMQNTTRDLAWKYALWSVAKINFMENNSHEQHMLSAMVTSFATWFYMILCDCRGQVKHEFTITDSSMPR